MANKKVTYKVKEGYEGCAHYTKKNGKNVVYVLGEVSQKVLKELHKKDGVGDLIIKLVGGVPVPKEGIVDGELKDEEKVVQGIENGEEGENEGEEDGENGLPVPPEK